MITKEDVKREIKKHEKFIDPTQEDFMIIKETTDLIKEVVTTITPNYIASYKDCVAGGSSSRRTFLPGKLEIDLFARFKTKEVEDLEMFAHQVVPKIGVQLNVETYLKYSENPYGYLEIEVKQRLVSVDLVATIFAKNYRELRKALNVSGMARTPFHSEYLGPKIKGKEQEIRALKFWLKRKRCYGNASLTGFLAELLVIKFGSFYDVLKQLPKILEITIDPFDRSESKLRKKFPHDQVIIVDPTDASRNAAAGIQGFIGNKKVSRIIEQSKKSLQNEKMLFKPIKIPEKHVIIIIDWMSEPTNEDDKFYMLARLTRAIFNEATMYDYKINDVFIEAEIDTIIICPRLDSFKKEKRLIKGPPLHIKQAVNKFKEAHNTTWTEENRLYTSVPNKYQTILDLIKTILGKYTISKTTKSQQGYIKGFNIKTNLHSDQLSQLLE